MLGREVVLRNLVIVHLIALLSKVHHSLPRELLTIDKEPFV